MAKKPPKTEPLGDAALPVDSGLSHPLWERPMTPKQLARFLQVSASTVHRQLTHGLPHVRVAGQIRFIPKEVLRYYRSKKDE